MKKRTSAGQFERQRQILWDGSNWDDGYVDNKGRFRVYRPDYPRAYALGYCLRAHIVWWLHTGIPHPEGTNLHHRDEDRLNDRINNLELLDHGQHTRHHQLQLTQLSCAFCGDMFIATGKQMARRRHEGKEPKYCSQACYHSLARTEKHKKAISEGLKRAYREGVR